MFPPATRQAANMSNTLLVTSSVFGDKSKSREVALDLLHALRSSEPGMTVTVRDTNAIAHLSGAMLGAVMTAPEQRNGEQIGAVGQADTLIAEVEAADVIVIAAPMYNFT